MVLYRDESIGPAWSGWTHAFVQCAAPPERENGEELCPLVPPFSLLLRDEDELGLDVDALLEKWRVLQSERTQRGMTNCDLQCVITHKCRINLCTDKQSCDVRTKMKSRKLRGVPYLSSRLGVLCTEHRENSSPGSILSASASWAGWITSGWCGLKTQ